jgi:hypothetical protein
MASSFSDLGIELMATGENAGTWGDKTNTNLQIVEKAIAGYVEQAVTSGGTTALGITDGTTTESDSVARHAVIKLTGTISGNSIVTVPDSIEKVYIVTNGTSGAYTVQFKTASGTGITFGVSEKTTRLVYSDGTNLVDAGFSGASDMEGRELVLDADGDTTITADTDDQIDIKIAGADDFQFTANTFTAQSGSSIVVPEGGLTFGSTAITSTAAELNLLDGVSGLVQADLTKLAAVDSTAAELNIVDGGTSATATTVADADRVVLNDNGTMVQVAVTDLAAYFDDEITAMPNLTSVGTLTTLTVDNVIVNGTTIGHTSDTDLITLADGVATVAGEVSMTTLDIGGTNVTATAAEINLIDGGATIGTTAIADGDGILHNDGGTMKVTTATTFKTYFQTGVTAAAIAADDISSGDAAINFTTSSGNITIDAAANDSDIIFKGTDNSSDITMLTLDGSDAGSATFNHDVILANDSFVQFGDAGENIAGDGTDLTINSSGDVIMKLTGEQLILHDGSSNIGQFDLTSNNLAIEVLGNTKDMFFKGFNGGASITALTLDMSAAGTATFNHDIIIADGGQIGSASDVDAMTIASNGQVTFTQTLIGTALDISGNIDVDGITNLDAVDIDGAVDMNSTLAVGGIASFAVAANVAQVALSSSSNAVAWDASAAANAFHVTTENTTFSAPSNAVEGAFICLEINYNGSHTIAFNTVFEFAASTAPTATSTDGKTDILVFRYNGAVWQEVGRTLNLSES